MYIYEEDWADHYIHELVEMCVSWHNAGPENHLTLLRKTVAVEGG